MSGQRFDGEVRKIFRMYKNYALCFEYNVVRYIKKIINQLNLNLHKKTELLNKN